MKTLTPQQQRVLDYISREIEERGYPPSVREICAALGFRSSSTAHRYLAALEEKGYLERAADRPRAMRILDSAGSRVQCRYVPIIGRIRAGKPLLAEENMEGYFPLPAEFAAGGEYFILRVEGESMSGAGIHDGDFVIVRRQQTVENGEIAALLLGEEATVKRFYREKDYFRLQPENEQFEPILTREVEVLGKVTGLFRRM
ncbi:MAG TPA: transcriptional repressor LexA [Bacillota bacterium]|jgi:repressor LexA|nr:transcriptional repressor LexA [Bacillota bacterium]HOA34987.1 transcriptional repressor LexA [Bacillota bacterium]HOJ84785.1 transcriptional repressor LexA [Bacillota bacterium]HOL15810.1 transcriptional repressor LexA [Bacillota bacterium]HPZ11144.1 transcriptional repressor LexA [Bacillota bacterium]